ncbi:MAG TPA: ABC transporter substrate-binding protein [Terrimicrobiaceae bacterium]|nr:ABC transporter substrate-binding protein [Terrimicrobiaceae bacterium]
MRFSCSLTTAILTAAIAVSGCKKPPTEPAKPTPPPEDPQATRIGFFAPMSGAQASFGTDALNGAKLAVEELNAGGGVLGHPVKLMVKDTQSRTDETEAVVAELTDSDKAAVLIGEIATDRSLVAAPLAQARGVPMITPASTSEKVTAVGDGIFRVCYTDAFQAGVMAKFARSIDVQKAAILSDASTPYSAGLAESFRKEFSALGGTIVAEESYRTGDKDFAAQLQAIKAQSPEIIFLPSYYAEAALIIQEARKQGIDAPFLGTDGWDSPEFLKVGGGAVDNSYFCSHFASETTSEAVKRFVGAYAAKFGNAPPPLAALTYDAVMLAADALKRAGSTDPAGLRQALAATADFPGVTGGITFDADRNPRKPGIVIRVDEGKFTYLETVDP